MQKRCANMAERFIKYLPNDKAAWLRKHHTALYLLLSLAVERVRWDSEDSPLGLKQGDVILGSFEEAGISRQQYRDAILMGENLGIWEVVYNRKCKKLLETPKRTIKGTIKCIVVNLRETMCWDANLKVENHQENHQGTIKEPSENHKQEQLRTNKNIKEEHNKLHDVVEFSFENLEMFKTLTQVQQISLKNKFGVSRIKLALDYAKIVPTKTTLIQLIYWHCAQADPPQPPIPAEQKIRTNHSKALEYEKIIRPNQTVRFDVLSTRCEIVYMGAQHDPKCFEYEQDPQEFNAELSEYLSAFKLIKTG